MAGETSKAVMPCWGEEGLDVVSALAGQMFPVLDGHFTYATWMGSGLFLCIVPS